jgi:hypothetical protein
MAHQRESKREMRLVFYFLTKMYLYGMLQRHVVMSINHKGGGHGKKSSAR